jgi:hypothetical protein
LISYTAPDGNACTIQLSQSSSLTPLALDVDPGTFANSNSDLSRSGTLTVGLSRTVVLGQRTSQYATAGTYSGVRHFSRALQAYTRYYGLLTCPSTGDILNFTFTTSNIPLGQTYGDPWLSDPSHPGDQPWPEWVGGLTPESFIDPLTGANEYRIGLRGNLPTVWNLAFGSAFNRGQTAPCDSAGPWTSPCNVTAGSGSTTVGNSTAPLVLRPSLAAVNNPWNTNYNSGFSLEELGASLSGYVNSNTAGFRNLDFCFSLNGGASCATGIRQITMGQTASTTVVGAAPTSIWVATQFGVDPWLLDTNPRLNSQETSPHSGTAMVTNNSGTYTVTNNGTGDSFSLYWITNGNGTIRLSSNNDACVTPPASTTSAEYRIASFTNGNTLLLASGAPPTGSNIYWCEDNFSIMVWRDQLPTDGSTVTLTGATLNVLGSSSPSYSDNGAGTACFNKAVYGGYFCLYGGMYWINPSGPSTVSFGSPVAAGLNSSNAPIANSWTRVQAPTAESAAMNQTASNFTFYMTGGDPASTPPGAPLAIQGVFMPSASPVQPTTPQSGVGIAQIQNAPVAASDAYSVTWTATTPSPWSMTWTNLSPQVSSSNSTCLGITSPGCGIVQQMAAFDPTFIPSYFNQSATGGWNCSLSAAASQGIFYFPCYSGGGDSPAWIFAFSPGDGVAAHAGQPGGPQIIGAVNTFNTPAGPVAPGQSAMTGRSLHGIGESGETGWLGITASLNWANTYVPVNTSANSAGIPASGPHPCTYYGISGNTNDCILVNINSYTSHGVTGYEPYLATPPSPWLGTPGEERTVQIGDTACISTGQSCGYTGLPASNELMTLVAKNYESINGAWVLQRGSNGTELAISASTPITLWWESIQTSIPMKAIGQSISMMLWWNPTAGCGGSPDPHGACMRQDTNWGLAHSEWREGGEAGGMNVPEWAVPTSAVGINVPWPTDYQTIVGSVPGILSLPSANMTPYAVAGVNYVSGGPPFAGAFGVPFQPDGGTHPNAPGANASAYEALQAFDNLPLQGGSFEPSFTAVSGQLYRYRPTNVVDPDDFYSVSGGSNGSGVTTINRKLMATGASCGSHPLIDVSGPSCMVGTGAASSYTYGMVRANGECYSGSQTGDVYVNCPGVSWPYCEGLSIHGGVPLGVGNDLCVGNISKVADAIIQLPLNHTDYYDAYTRMLASATSRVRMVSGFENNRLLPDNSWLLYRQEFLNYQRQEMWMAELPPYPATDSVARGTFVPVALTLTPPAGLGANNAIVEFGYQEYGAPQLVDCTTRNDACIATASTVTPGNQPFYFASENPAGASCTSGCTITIPAISQRILYYQIRYRTATNAVLATSPLMSVVVP